MPLKVIKAHQCRQWALIPSRHSERQASLFGRAMAKYASMALLRWNWMNLLALTTQSYSRSYQYLKHGPGHFLMYAFGRFGVVRSFMVWVYSLRNVTPLSAARPTLIQDVDVDEAAGAIYLNGFFPGLHLRKDVVEQLLTFSSMATCIGDGNSDLPFRYGEKEIVERQSGHTFKLGKFLHAFSASPVLQALASGPQLRAIARKYLRTEPVLVSARMWWSFSGPTDAKQQMRDGQGFHYDIDGYRALALFFYLTDVGPSDRTYMSEEVTRGSCCGISFQFIRVAMTLKSEGSTGSSAKLFVVVPQEANLPKTYLVFIRTSIRRVATDS
jgi:hypothetical protein